MHFGRVLAAGCLWAVLGFAGGSAAAQEYFGAIAYSPSTRAHGWSYDYDSRREAERRAQAQCSRHARDCEVPVWFRNACGALAVGSDGYGSGWGATRKAAEGSAVRSCARFSGSCTVIRWVCTSR